MAYKKLTVFVDRKIIVIQYCFDCFSFRMSLPKSDAKEIEDIIGSIKQNFECPIWYARLSFSACCAHLIVLHQLADCQ